MAMGYMNGKMLANNYLYYNYLECQCLGGIPSISKFANRLTKLQKAQIASMHKLTKLATKIDCKPN
jgi:hypothetical protein